MIVVKYSLIRIIAYDIFRHGIVSLIMLIIIFISAILIVTVSYQTRLLTAEKALMIEEKESLDVAWRNLILEENLLKNHKRIEQLSREKLQMMHVDPRQEHIIIVK